MSQALAVKEAIKVYKVALMSGHDQRTAIRAARRATDILARQETEVIGGWEIWKGIATPGQIRDEINRIDGEVKSTGSDLATLEAVHLHDANGPEITRFMDAVWDPFITSWTKFWTGHQGWTDNMWGGTWDQAQTFQRQLAAVRQSAKNLGLPLRSPDPIKQEPNAFESIVKAIWGLVKVIIIVGLVIVGVMVLTKMPLAKFIGRK